MKRTDFVIRLRVPVLMLVALLLAASSAYGVNLAAVEAQWTPPDSATPITMWGFVADPGSCPTGPVSWNLGPQQIVAAGGSLTINLRNCLSEPVSIIIPGQNLPSGAAPVWTDDSTGPRTLLTQRVRSFVQEAPADNGASTTTYTWNNMKSGTFLYQSGTHPALQVHMGLYGALKVGQYRDTHYAETMIVFSEIDPALHDPVPTTATPLEYAPKYYLINGDSFATGQPVPAITVGQAQKRMLIRFLNAGLMTRIPVLQGPHMKIIAEDGNRYPYPKNQYSLLLTAGKTMDVLWYPNREGNHALYDRRLALTSNGVAGGGMLVNLNVGEPFPWFMFVAPTTRNQ